MSESKGTEQTEYGPQPCEKTVQEAPDGVYRATTYGGQEYRAEKIDGKWFWADGTGERDEVKYPAEIIRVVDISGVPEIPVRKKEVRSVPPFEGSGACCKPWHAMTTSAVAPAGGGFGQPMPNPKQQFKKQKDGTWSIYGCCGGGCYVVNGMKFCPFCGAKRDENP